MAVKRRKNMFDRITPLDGRFYDTLEPVNDSGTRPSPQRIKTLALEKTGLRRRKDINTMKKLRIGLLAAALAVVLGVTVLAMGGMDYFRGIFGDSVAHVAGQIGTPEITATGQDGSVMSVHAILSDGYQTNAVFSTKYPSGVENNDPDKLDQHEEGQEPFQISLKGMEASWSVRELPEFAAANQRFFLASINSMKNCMGQSVEIRRNADGLMLKVPLNGDVAVRTVKIDREAGQGRSIETLQISPLGILLTSSEKEAKGSLPTVDIRIRLQDGEEDATLFFDSGSDEETVTGGGGAVILAPGQKGPLVVSTQARRNPDGKLIAIGTFGRILNLEQVREIVVEGTAYPLS